jgi:hypothetical protein
MAQIEDALARPEFEVVDLDVDTDETHDRIEDTIKGLATAETDDGVKYRTTDGMLVAIVAPRPSGSGDTKSQVAYRTDPESIAATRKATKIKEALRPHTINR